MTDRSPAYDLRRCHLDVVAQLCADHHGHGSAGANATYAWAVYEEEWPVAGYVWQPPPPGAAAGVCAQVPGGVLSLSRMVAVPREDRRLRHVSTPLRRQMKLIDRGRWPVLVTYSDEGQGHTGHVYKCSGWTPTRKSLRPVFEDENGRRASSYSNGRSGGRTLVRAGSTTIQRWEHWVCAPGEVLAWMARHGWERVPLAGKTWRSGRQAFTWCQAGR